MRTRSRGNDWNNLFSGGNKLYCSEYFAQRGANSGPVKYFAPFSDLCFAYLANPAFTTPPPGTVMYTWSEIQDDPSLPMVEKPLVHKKVEAGQVQHHYTAKDLYGGNGWLIARGAILTPHAPDAPVGGSESLINDERRNAWSAFQPQFESGFSGLNFLYELKDFKSWGKLFDSEHLVSKAQSVWNWFFANFKPEQRAIALTKTASELSLEYKFNLKPFCRDVFKLRSVLQNLNHHLVEFNRQGKLINKFHYTSRTNHSKYKWDGGPGGLTDYWHYAENMTIFSAQIQTQWFHEVDGLLDLFLQYYGLQLTPKRVWDAIPFSFVVDMLFTVGESLERIRRSGVSRVDFGVYSESTKAQMVRCFTLKNTGLNGGRTRQWYLGECGNPGIEVIGAGEIPVAWSRYKIYRRTPYPEMPFVSGYALPSFRWGDKMSNPGSKLLTLGSMLATGLKSGNSSRYTGAQ